jgi:hypothetical protein
VRSFTTFGIVALFALGTLGPASAAHAAAKLPAEPQTIHEVGHVVKADNSADQLILKLRTGEKTLPVTGPAAVTLQQVRAGDLVRAYVDKAGSAVALVVLKPAKS